MKNLTGLILTVWWKTVKNVKISPRQILRYMVHIHMKVISGNQVQATYVACGW